MNNIKSPIKWVGRKRQLASFLISQFPEHKNYIEVFGGGLSVLFAKPRSKLEVVNDYDGNLINLWKVIKHYPQTLSDRLNTMWYSRELFDELKNQPEPTNKIDKAARTYYLIMASFGSQQKYFGRHLKLKKPNIWRDFTVVSQRLKYVQIENLDFEQILKDYDKDESFFYCDPPYYKSEDMYLTKTFNHERLKKALSNVKSKWLLSYNDCDYIRELYKDYNIQNTPIISYPLSKNTYKTNEIIITNY